MTYKWDVHDENDVPFDEADMTDFYAAGNTDEEVSILSTFFSEATSPLPESNSTFYVQLTATNAEGGVGVTQMKLKKNYPPDFGNCTVTPTYGFAMLDEFKLECTDWSDPEGMGIAIYEIYSKKNTY